MHYLYFFCKCRAVDLWEILIAALEREIERERGREMEGEKIVVWGFLDMIFYKFPISILMFPNNLSSNYLQGCDSDI